MADEHLAGAERVAVDYLAQTALTWCFAAESCQSLSAINLGAGAPPLATLQSMLRVLHLDHDWLLPLPGGLPGAARDRVAQL